jgi:hypothetical protein
MTRGLLAETPDGGGDESHPGFVDLHGAREGPSTKQEARTVADFFVLPRRAAAIVAAECASSLYASAVLLRKYADVDTTHR